MWPTLFKIPWLNLPVRSYGLMLMVAFVGGTWWAARRALRVKGDPDFVVNMGFLGLISSIIGARIFYVVHYWERSFAGRGLWAIVDITAGGLEFYGGFIGAVAAVMLHMVVRKQSLRLYLDILAPSVMFGMSMARIGCFLNGCCWGGPCPPQLPWGVRFPYGSPAVHRQWEQRQITLPADLIVAPHSGTVAYLIPRDLLDMSVEEREGPGKAFDRADETFQKAKTADADARTLAKIEKGRDKAARRLTDHQKLISPFINQAERHKLLPSELESLARRAEHWSAKVHPAQLYASLGGLVTAGLLNTFFYRRKRHGMVFGLLLLCYPVMRIVEEMIRIDNPHDTLGLTVSQFVSVMMIVCGIVWMYLIHQRPLRSPKAVACLPPPRPPDTKNTAKRKR